MKAYNFFAGPAVLPQEVIAEAAEAVKSFTKDGLSILEISHRSKPFVAVMDESEALVRELLGLSDDYAVLFLTGGASSQFFVTAMNLLNKKAGYLNTGTWSVKAIKEAKLYGEVNEVASSEDKNFNYIPKGYAIPSDLEYLHLTSNNTIFGTQIHEWPETDVPYICDMSSDIMSRPLPVEKFDLIYAGAQKNLGPAGTTLVIVKKDILGKVERVLPTMLDYRTHIKKGSMFNTPPAYPIYVSMLVMRWVKKLGGLEAMAKRNQEKAAVIYDAIDASPVFYGTTAKEDRSLMNICFNVHDSEKETAFVDLCDAEACVGIKGHRSVGGFRASTYNAMSMEGVNKLASLINSFK